MLPPPHDTLTVSQPRFKEGDFVKIRRRGEGFWCRILSCAGEALDVRVVRMTYFVGMVQAWVVQYPV